MTSSNKKMVLKKLKEYNTIWHPDSTVVFKSQSERLVIGRYVDGELIPLDETALSLCEEWKFKPDESLLEAADSEEQEDSGEEEDEKADDSEEVNDGDKADDSEEVNDGDKANDSEEQEDEEADDGEEEKDPNPKSELKPVKETLNKKEISVQKPLKNVTSSKMSYGNISNDVARLLQKTLFEILGDINDVFDEVLEEKYEETLKSMSSDYEQQIKSLREELSSVKDELSNVTEKYNSIKQKFDAMKSLFN